MTSSSLAQAPRTAWNWIFMLPRSKAKAKPPPQRAHER